MSGWLIRRSGETPKAEVAGGRWQDKSLEQLVTLTYPPPTDFEDLKGGQYDTARLWISDQQWMSILKQVEHGPTEEELAEEATDFAGGASDATGGREHARHAISFRCLIRLAPPEDIDADRGTYVVHSRNISSGGLGFVHDQPLHAGTRCTVALQPLRGKGMIVPARVAWCRDIQRLAEDVKTYDVGVQFDRPIDVSPYIPAA
ncbi:MAG: PilZ domain-containing protein [Planctomycetota bacterium]